MTPQLTPEMESAVQQQHGGPVHVVGTGAGSYVLMSMEVYRDLMGVGTDADFAASVEAVKRGYEAVHCGQSRPLREALDDLGRRHEVPG
jgi:hypothetical protein